MPILFTSFNIMLFISTFPRRKSFNLFQTNYWWHPSIAVLIREMRYISAHREWQSGAINQEREENGMFPVLCGYSQLKHGRSLISLNVKPYPILQINWLWSWSCPMSKICHEPSAHQFLNFQKVEILKPFIFLSIWGGAGEGEIHHKLCQQKASENLECQHQ